MRNVPQVRISGRTGRAISLVHPTHPGSEHLDVWGETATNEQKWRANFRSGGVSRFVNTAVETTGARGIGFVGVFERRIEQFANLIGQVI
ncbi:MAG: hypothetical protein ACI85K_003278 [Hyphomicrobiaceae bacterium]|jgi:hypothetical protein